jgi:hypothetical protein
VVVQKAVGKLYIKTEKFEFIPDAVMLAMKMLQSAEALATVMVLQKHDEQPVQLTLEFAARSPCPHPDPMTDTPSQN